MKPNRNQDLLFFFGFILVVIFNPVQSLRILSSSNSTSLDPAAALPINNPEINKICDSTDHPHLCVSSIPPYYTGKSDPISVLEMTMKATRENIKQSISKMARLGNIASDSAGNNTCEKSYNDALQDVQNAIHALPNRGAGAVKSMLNAAMMNVSTCADELTKNTHGFNFDSKLIEMVSNCLDIASLIE